MSTLTAPIDEVHEMSLAAIAEQRHRFDRLRAEVDVWSPAPCPEGWS